MTRRIGFIGSGQMAQALAGGFVRGKKATTDCLIAGDVLPAAREAFAAKIGCKVVADNHEVAANTDILILAVKPQGMDAVLAGLRPAVTANHLVISIATGISLARLAEGLGQDRRLIRVMPNTPCLVGASASAFAVGGTATEADAQETKDLLESVGIAYRVTEPLLDAVTGLSGSGPAYIYQVIEAMSDGGVRAGLPRDIATRLAAQTVLGAAKMVLETGLHPGQLKDMVTSPAGTTIAALSVLERASVRSAFIDAVDAAAQRARELGRS